MNSSFRLLKKYFQLDPKYSYLNHGSFGACPLPIFDERSKFQKEIELQPVSFVDSRAAELLDWSRDALSSYLHCNKDDVVYFPNPTTAMNMVINGNGVRSFSTQREVSALITQLEELLAGPMRTSP